MMSPATSSVTPLRAGALELERQARIDLAACYRLVAHFGMDDLVYTHISARVPGHPDQFLINPYGMMFHEITASSLVKVDREGKILDDTPYPVNLAGIVIHSAVLSGRPDVNCVVHTHTRAGVAVSCLEQGLMPINQFALMFHGRLAYHDYEGIALDFDECSRLQMDLGDKAAMILRNHGLLTVGRTIPDAFSLIYYLEQSCRVQLDLMAAGGKITTLSPEVCERTANQFGNSPVPRGEREWPALLRLLDVKDPSFRD
ncbi:MAG TPA: class II aldolase/adducin family protein [Stellaceae bacterium]|nr:class II aldolase/adducin family protein [Stellaceae bacterium]